MSSPVSEFGQVRLSLLRFMVIGQSTTKSNQPGEGKKNFCWL